MRRHGHSWRVRCRASRYEGSLWPPPLQADGFVSLFEEPRLQGVVEGQNLTVNRRGFDARYDQFSALAAEFLSKAYRLSSREEHMDRIHRRNLMKIAGAAGCFRGRWPRLISLWFADAHRSAR